jgi:predicted dithiol-disulfide oxidoreductase (DUF899 family)
MTDHKVVSPKEWQSVRDELLQREKEHTRAGDELARERRELPWVTVEKEYRFDTDDGTRTLAELFDGRSQLMFYHFMFGPSYQAGCPVNSSMADGLDGLLPHLHARDVTLLLVSQAPLAKLQTYKQRMGWRIPWVPHGVTGGQRLYAPGRRGLPGLYDHRARRGVHDALLPDPGPGGEGARRGRRVPDLDSPP